MGKVVWDEVVGDEPCPPSGGRGGVGGRILGARGAVRHVWAFWTLRPGSYPGLPFLQAFFAASGLLRDPQTKPSGAGGGSVMAGR